MPFNDSANGELFPSVEPLIVHVSFASGTGYYQQQTVCNLLVTAGHLRRVVGPDGLESATCIDCSRILTAVFRTDLAECSAAQLLEQADAAGVKVLVDERGICKVRGMWWQSDLIDAISAREDEIVSLLTGGRPVVTFTPAEVRRLEFQRWRFRELSALDRAA